MGGHFEHGQLIGVTGNQLGNRCGGRAPHRGGVAWRGFVIGAVLALSLWVMLLYGLYGIYKTFRVPAQQYAAAAVAAVAVGFLIFKLTHDNTLVWPPAFIVVGTGAIALSAIRRTKAEDN